MSTTEQRIEKIEEAKTLHSVYRKLRLLHYNGYRVFTQPRPIGDYLVGIFGFSRTAA